MSLEYTCYSAGKRLLSPQRIQAMASGWQFLFVDADSERPLALRSPLPSFCLVWGCRGTSLDLRGLVRDGWDNLNPREQQRVGCCELSAGDLELDPGCLADLPPRLRAASATMHIRYDSRSSAGQADVAWELQKALCRAIAQCAGGLLENPQSGERKLIQQVPTR
jgi:hypothetical protein